MTQETISRKAPEKFGRATVADAQRKRITREMSIPELYRRPMGCRELHGCLKARA
ncbi:MAG: hypothetical protein RBT81_07645 [Gammaproteobacteria bacterium]|jgi:hypothetical protein|nr:hypothetical protein [Gammaproteobacteria bacterium]